MVFFLVFAFKTIDDTFEIEEVFKNKIERGNVFIFCTALMVHLLKTQCGRIA